MSLFGQRPEKNSNPRHKALADSIAGRIIRGQTRIAAYLNGKAIHLSAKARLLLLIVFCILFAAINGYLLIHSIYS